MGLFKRKRSVPSGGRSATSADLTHLESWARARRGVEAYVEPRTIVTETTVVLIAVDGEWTRRRISGPDQARELGKRLAIPVYDANIVGYPQRMRDWTARQVERDR